MLNLERKPNIADIAFEQLLYMLIVNLYTEITLMHPADGLSSPRDIALVTEINKKTAILDHMQDAMRVINPGFEIREN